MTLPCMRNKPEEYTVIIPVEVETPSGLWDQNCRVTYSIGEQDRAENILIEIAIMRLGKPVWRDVDNALDAPLAEAIRDRVEQMDEVLLAHAKEQSDWNDINADDLGHARRERLAERRLGR